MPYVASYAAEEADYANVGELVSAGMRDGWAAPAVAGRHDWAAKLANLSPAASRRPS